MAKIEDLEGREFEVRAYGHRYTVQIALKKYHEGRAWAVQLYTDEGEPFATLTTNIPGVKLAEDELLIKGWSENEATAKAAMKTGWFERTNKIVPTGFAVAEVWRVLG